jgi:hypothetical protein
LILRNKEILIIWIHLFYDYVNKQYK